MEIEIHVVHYLVISTVMLFCGIYGFFTRKNLLALLISVELMLNATNINFAVFNRYLFPGQLEGHFFSLFGIAIAATVIAAVFQFGAALKDNPMGAIKSLLGLVLLVAVVLISYAMGSDATITANEAPYTDTFWLKITDMFIYSIYFLLGIAALATLVNMTGIFKK